MKFVTPEFLYALSAIAIPIVIHLFKFRRHKKVYFSNTKFLKDVQELVKSRSKLKHLLILLSRIIAILFLVLAFAQPFLPNSENKNATKDKSIAVYIDNSFSMEAKGKNGTLLQEAKEIAINLAKSYAPTDQFNLITNDLFGYQNRLISRDDFIQEIDKINGSTAHRSLESMLDRQRENLGDKEGRNYFVLSDFQESMLSDHSIETDSLGSYHFLRLEAQKQENIFIDSIWFEKPIRNFNEPEELFIRVVNQTSDAVQDLNVNLELNDQVKGIGTVSIEPNDFGIATISYSNSEEGIIQGVVKVEDFQIHFDDDYFFSYKIERSSKLIEISGVNAKNHFSDLLNEEELVAFSKVSELQLDQSSLPMQNVVVLNEVQQVSSGLKSLLVSYVKNGGHLVLFPSLNMSLIETNELLLELGCDRFGKLDTNSTNVGKLFFEHDFFKGVFKKIPKNPDFPQVKAYFPLEKRTETVGEVLMELENGKAFLSTYASGEGRVYVYASGLTKEFGNYGNHSLFVASQYRIMERSRASLPLEFKIGSRSVYPLKNWDKKENKKIHVIGSNGINFIPEIDYRGITKKVILNGDDQGIIKEAGTYFLQSDSIRLGGVSFNYSRDESEMKFADHALLTSWKNNNGLEKATILNAKNKTWSSLQTALQDVHDYWKICLIFVLVFLAIETLLVKLWKNE